MLPPKIFELVATHLKTVGLQKCPVCGVNSWETQTIISPEVLESADPSGVRLMRMGGTIPLVLVSCTNCYNTLQFLLKPLQAKAAATELPNG
jgi:hypothetical protein